MASRGKPSAFAFDAWAECWLNGVAGIAVNWHAKVLVGLAPLWLAWNACAQSLDDLASTNRDQTHLFWSAVEGSNGPVTLLGFGDSVATSICSAQTYLFAALQQKLGIAGYSIENGDNRMLWQFGPGAGITAPSTNWWTWHGLLPAGSFIFWTNYWSPGGALFGDTAGVFWVSQPDGGTFALRVSTNGADWSAPLLQLDGFSPIPTGRYARTSLPKGYYRLRLDGLSGTNVIIGPQYLDSTSSGANIAFMAAAGASLDQVFAVPTNVLCPIISALNPQLVVWHMKELADIGATGLSNRLEDLEAAWRASVTNGDVVYIGTPYEARDLTSDYTRTQNRIVRGAAVRNRRAYIDCMNPFISYTWMTNHGMLADDVHPSSACYSEMAEILWRELGFFAVRVDRHLAIERLANVTRLLWPTTAGLDYELQISPNLVDWTSLQSSAGDGNVATFTNANTGAGALFFRLSVTAH